MITVTFTKDTVLPPGIINLSGKTYAVRAGEFIEIPYGTKMKDVKFIYKKPFPKFEVKPKKEVKETHFESSSKGDKQYTIEITRDENGKAISATCSCPGFGFRRKCRHSDKYLK